VEVVVARPAKVVAKQNNRDRSRIFGGVFGANHDLSDHQNGYIHMALDPCGEYYVHSEHAKIPDGALPNSFIMGFREAFGIYPPGHDASTMLPLDGSNWSLTIVSVPLFRHPAILIADMQNREFSRDTEILISRYLSSLPDSDHYVYPNWSAFSFDDNLFFCFKSWTTLKNVAPANNSGSPLLSQFRITSKGLSCFFNTPTLINQGMICSAQWNSGSTTMTDTINHKPDDTTDVSFSITNGLSGGTPTTFFIANPTLAMILGVVSVSQPTSGAIGSNTTADHPITAPFVVNTADGQRAMTPGTDRIRTRMETQGVGTFYIRIQANNPSLVPSISDIVTGTLRTPSSLTVEWPVTLGDDLTFVQNTTSLNMPPLSVDSIVQSTPKAVVLRAVEGSYLPHRFFQPIAGVQEGLTSAPVAFRTFHETAESEHASSGFRDAADRNIGCGVIALRGISLAATPWLKIMSTVECVASEGSPYMVNMAENAPGDEVVFQIVKDVGERLPFAFPERFNFLGKLAGMVTGIIKRIPIVGNIARPVIKAVDSVIGGLTGSNFDQKDPQVVHNEVLKRIHDVCGTLANMQF
jgi:hypothetical protein